MNKAWIRSLQTLLSLVCLVFSVCSILSLSIRPFWSFIANSSVAEGRYEVNSSLFGTLEIVSDSSVSLYSRCAQITDSSDARYRLRSTICSPLSEASQITLIVAPIGHFLLLLACTCWSIEALLRIRSSRFMFVSVIGFAVVGTVLSSLAMILYAVYIPSLSDFKAYMRVHYGSSYGDYNYTSSASVGFIYYAVFFSCAVFCSLFALGLSLVLRFARADPPRFMVDQLHSVLPSKSFDPGNSESFRSVHSFVQPNPLLEKEFGKTPDALSPSRRRGNSPTKLGVDTRTNVIPDRTSPRASNRDTSPRKESATASAHGPSAGFSQSYYWATLMNRRDPPSPRKLREDSIRNVSAKAITFEPSSTGRSNG